MRTIAMGMLIVLVLGITTTCLWWNSARIEAWAEDTKHEWKTEQDRQQVKHAEAFLRKGLAELDREIERLENVRYKHRVACEEASLRATKAQNAATEAEELTVAFLRAQKAASVQTFEFYGRAYDGAQAEKQFDAFSRETLARRQTVDELHYDEVSHRQAAEYLAGAVKTLKEAREKAQREGNRLVIDRDVADARALAQTLRGGAASSQRGNPGAAIIETLELLRRHLERREAEGRVPDQGGACTISEIQQQRRETEKSDELKRLKDELRQRAKNGKDGADEIADQRQEHGGEVFFPKNHYLDGNRARRG
jgi:hypothetical protein